MKRSKKYEAKFAMEAESSLDSSRSFKPFHETFKWITFTLTIGLMFPNPATERQKRIAIVSLLVCVTPLYTVMAMDMFQCWRTGDIFNVIRHSTVLGPSLGAIYKMMLMYYKRVQAKAIMDEINRDYKLYSALPKHQREIALASINDSVFYAEKVWAVLVTAAILAFPGVALVMTVFSYLFHDEPKRYMVHDVVLPASEKYMSFTTPYYEILNVYMTFAALISVFNYVSYDGYFGLCTNHACLKMNMYCERLKDVLRRRSERKIYAGVVGFIQEQNRLFGFIELIQETFDLWLATIFVSTMIEVGSLLFHISAGYGFDFKYSLFSVTAVVHIFLPCKYASNLKAMSLETSTLIYCSGWEHSRDHRIRRVVPFLIARAQRSSHITVFKMMDFDVEVFLFLMRTSYSMFTLLRS